MKCVQVCPAKIFVLKPIIEKKNAYAKEVEIKALFKDMCNGCMECVEICPEQCISVEFWCGTCTKISVVKIIIVYKRLYEIIANNSMRWK